MTTSDAILAALNRIAERQNSALAEAALEAIRTRHRREIERENKD